MSIYSILNENNNEIGTGVMAIHYGRLWKSVLDRLNHQFDGYLITIYHQGNKLRAYRRLVDKATV